MQLTQEQLDQYKKIYFNKYWFEISDAEALKQWISLINFMKTVLKNDKK